MTQKTEDTMEQIDKALDEMDGAGSDQTIFRLDNDTFRYKDVEFKLIENYREAFDLEMMEHRFTDYLLKYDYIVGDIAYEKLRLRGFFDDQRKGVPIDMKISNLEDYLVEYCNFGCQYFVFERVEKKKGDPESYFKRPKKQNRGRKNNSKNNNRRNQRNQESYKQRNQQNNRSTNKGKTNQQTNNKQAAKEFEVVKKQEEQTQKNTTRKETKATPKKKEASKKTFKIRKKND